MIARKFYIVVFSQLLILGGCAMWDKSVSCQIEGKKDDECPETLFSAHKAEPSAIDIEHERNEEKRSGPNELRGLLKRW